MARMKEVADDAGVSVATVSYVINKTKYVSPELTLRVEKSIEKLDYNTNPVARSLRNKKTMSIGIVLQNIRNIFFPQLLAGLEESLREKGYNLLFVNTYNDIDEEWKTIQSLRGMWVDGIILDSCCNEKNKTEYAKHLNHRTASKHIPILLLERNLGIKELDAVSIDNFNGAYIATKHLIDSEHRQIMHIAGNKDWSMSIDRLEGYLKALSDYGLESRKFYNYGSFLPQDGYSIMKEILDQHHNIDGLFAANDQMAIGAMKAILEYGLKIPEDIAVVGFDNIFVSSLINPTLSTINVPKYMIGKTAAEMLIESIEKPDKQPENRIMQTNLIVRQSSDVRGERSWDLFGW